MHKQKFGYYCFGKSRYVNENVKLTGVRMESFKQHVSYLAVSLRLQQLSCCTIEVNMQ